MPKYIVKSGSHRQGGNVFGKGDTFTADYIPESFKDKIEEVSDSGKRISRREREKIDKVKEVKLKLVSKGHGKYDVINEVTKKKINDKSLSKEEALLLMSPTEDDDQGDDQDDEDKE